MLLMAGECSTPIVETKKQHVLQCRPLHHNAHALRNVDYMVDEDELANMSRSAPPCDGESDLGEHLL